MNFEDKIPSKKRRIVISQKLKEGEKHLCREVKRKFNQQRGFFNKVKSDFDNKSSSIKSDVSRIYLYRLEIKLYVGYISFLRL